MKRTIPLTIAAAVGFVLIAAHFVPYTQSWGETAMIWFDILAAIALVLGGANLVKLSLKKISGRRPGWGYAGVTVIAFVVTLVLGLLKVRVTPPESYPEHTWAGNYLEHGSAMWWIYEYVNYPLAATMFALLAFFIASAAFRAFRAKNIGAVMLLGTAFIVLIGRTYAGEVLTGWLPADLEFANLTESIMDTIALAGNRAIAIGIALGVVSLSLKVLLGVDRSYLGSD